MAQVHIVLATYNGEKYIREQLDSILANTFQDFAVEVCGQRDTVVGLCCTELAQLIVRLLPEAVID